MVDRARREQHGDRRELRRDAAIRQDQDVHTLTHGLLGLGTEPIERRDQPRPRVTRLEQAAEGLRAEARLVELPQALEIGIGQHRMLDAQHAPVQLGLLEQVLFGAERRVEGHHRALVDRIHRRVRDLREQLLEVAIQQLRPVREAGQRRIFAHRADRPASVGGHRRQQDAEVFAGVAEDLLEPEARLGILLVCRHVGARQVAEHEALAIDPLAIGPPRHVAPLDLGVFENAALLEVDAEDLARMQALLDEHVLGRDVEHAHLGGHHHEAVLGDGVAGRAQAVAVEHRADLAAVGERDGGRPVPGLHQERVVLVVGAQVGIHVVPVLPGLRDHHQDRLGQFAAGEHEELERVVEAGRVARPFAHDRVEPAEVVAEQARRHRALASVHPVLVAADRVDLAVVRQITEGVREIPRAEGVGAVARVDQAEGRGELRIHDVREEVRDLRRDQHADVGDRAARQARHVEEVACAGLLADLLLDEAPDHVELALEGVGILGLAAPGGDEDLADARQARAGEATDRGRLVGDVAPAEQCLPFALDDALEAGFLLRGGRRILREEHHADRVAFALGQLDAACRALATQQRVRDLDEQAGAVAGLGIAAAGTAMTEIHEDLDASLHHVVGGLAGDVRDEADAAGVVLEGRVIEPLLSRHSGVHLGPIAGRPSPPSCRKARKYARVFSFSGGRN